VEPWLARAARIRGDRAALEIGSEAISYAALYQRASEVAGGLRERDVGVGDHVALALPSGQLVVALHACMLTGAVAVPIDLRLTAAERSFRRGNTKLVLDELVRGEGVSATDRSPHEIATVMFTSGTTAGPKAVALSYDNWLWNALGSALALGLDEEERWLCPMPLAHVGGLSIQIRSAIYGTTVLLHERFDTEAVLDALMDPGRRVTLVSLVPTMLSRLLDAGLREPPALRRALLGGGPIAPTLISRAAEAGVDVAPSYGMTEACSQIATDGWPLLGVELSIARGAPPARPDEPVVGEVLVRGRTVAAGALAPDGWLHTGDRGHFEADGRLVIEGRIADTIVTGGENVAPIEVEDVLLEHVAVDDAAVFGRSDPEWGERVVARVVVREAVEPDALRAHCAQRLAPFKVPKTFEFVSSVPRGPTGKLMRRELG
jgi:O-succinylbenzoic acid--CoA ligase